MMGLRLPELLVILGVVVLLFGAKKLPELGDSLGKGIRAFKNATERGFADDGGRAHDRAEVRALSQGAATVKPASVDAAKMETNGAA